MILSGTGILYPTKRSTQSILIPEGTKLAGLAYDYKRNRLMVGVNPASRVYAMDTSTGLLTGSLLLPIHITQLVDLAVNGDLLYILYVTSEGHLSIAYGSITEEDWQSYTPSYAPLPYGVIQSTYPADIWQATHSPAMEYMRYHPRFTSMFNIGSSLYMTLGLSGTATGVNIPTELGQWLVSYDLLGIIGSRYSLDQSQVALSRGKTSEGLNGSAIAATYIDGNVLLLCQAYRCPGQLKVLTIHPDNSVTWVGHDWMSETIDTSEFVSMASDARNLYVAGDSVIYKSRIQFLVLYVSEFDLYSPCVDIGTVETGQTVVRKVKIRNVSSTHYYDRIVVTSPENDILVSIDNVSFLDSVTFTPSPALGPGKELDLYIRISPTVSTEEQMQFIRSLYISARESVS